MQHKYYKIINIVPNTDRMDRLPSKYVYIERLLQEVSAILVYVDDEFTPIGKCMVTSHVKSFDMEDDIVVIETENNTYTLKEVAKEWLVY